MKTFLMALAGMVLATSAMAQQAPPTDPRLTEPALNALKAMLGLREAEMKALAEDFRKREAEWAEYSKPLWQAPAKKADAPK